MCCLEIFLRIIFYLNEAKNCTVEYIFVRKRSRKFEKSRAVFSDLLNRARAISKQGAPSNAIASGQNAPKALSALKMNRNNGHDFSRQKYGIPKYFKGDGEK